MTTQTKLEKIRQESLKIKASIMLKTDVKKIKSVFEGGSLQSFTGVKFKNGNGTLIPMICWMCLESKEVKESPKPTTDYNKLRKVVDRNNVKYAGKLLYAVSIVR